MQSQKIQTRQTLSQRTVLTQQQLRFVKLLELNAPEFDEAVERELEENEALEEKEGAPGKETPVRETVRRYIQRQTQGEDYEFAPADREESLYDHLYAQLAERRLPPRQEYAARYIIGNLDSNGYLREELPVLIDEMAFREGVDIPAADAEAALETVRGLDPAGIGGRDLRECLLIQLRREPSGEVRDNAMRIIEKTYQEFTMKHRDAIRARLRMESADIDRAIALILSLNPKPGAAFGGASADNANIIVPDYVIEEEDGNFTITLNNRIPELQVSRTFEQAVEALERTPSGRPKKGAEYIVARYRDARDFIRVATQRQETMMKVMGAIVKIQESYFRTRNVYELRPMMIKDIAEITGIDMSVISRATNNKYVATPWGIFPLHFFFSANKDDTEHLTNRQIEARIRKLVEKEDKRHPLSDQKLMEKINSEGFNLARRTVAKYRDKIGIPVARLRKEMLSGKDIQKTITSKKP